MEESSTHGSGAETPADAPGTEAPELPSGLEWVRPLGRGKMARVYLAREPELQRLVAVKVLRPELSGDETARLRFEREARSAASLSHPNVVSVHRFGRLDDGTPYLVMTYVRGRTLADRLQAEGPVGEAEGRALLAQLASALAAAHARGIVHRDIRPANVLVEEETGRALLADFGIAAVLEGGGGSGPRLTRTGQILGEPRYASPEQLRGDEVTGQADVYSLAVLAYELLTGEGPYRASSTREWISAHLSAEPRPLSALRQPVSAELEALLLRCLAREPAHRPRAEDVRKRLEATSDPSPGGAPGGAGAEAPGLMGRRVPQIVGAAVAGAVGLLGVMDAIIQNTDLPRVAFHVALAFCVWGVLASAVVAWFHGQRGRQEAPPVERWILAILAAGWLATTAVVLLR